MYHACQIDISLCFILLLQLFIFFFKQISIKTRLGTHWRVRNQRAFFSSLFSVSPTVPTSWSASCLGYHRVGVPGHVSPLPQVNSTDAFPSFSCWSLDNGKKIKLHYHYCYLFFLYKNTFVDRLPSVAPCANRSRTSSRLLLKKATSRRVNPSLFTLRKQKNKH